MDPISASPTVLQTVCTIERERLKVQPEYPAVPRRSGAGTARGEGSTLGLSVGRVTVMLFSERRMNPHEYREERFESLRDNSFIGHVLAESLVASDVDHVVVLDLAGALEGPGAEEFSNRIRGLLRRGERFVAVNLGAVTNVDSMGLGELVRAFGTVTRSGGEMAIVNPPPYFRRLVERLKFL
jgi:anti-anti-sigma factor